MSPKKVAHGPLTEDIQTIVDKKKDLLTEEEYRRKRQEILRGL